MRKAGITDYKAFSLDIPESHSGQADFARSVLDEFADMERQALEIASWGQNVYVKIPVMNTKRETQLQADREARCQEGQAEKSPR